MSGDPQADWHSPGTGATASSGGADCRRRWIAQTGPYFSPFPYPYSSRDRPLRGLRARQRHFERQPAVCAATSRGFRHHCSPVCGYGCASLGFTAGLSQFVFSDAVSHTRDKLWIDPVDSQDKLEDAVEILSLRGMNVSLYQRCPACRNAQRQFPTYWKSPASASRLFGGWKASTNCHRRGRNATSWLRESTPNPSCRCPGQPSHHAASPGPVFFERGVRQ